MKITSISAQQKNKERVSVFVDGKYEFSLSLDELVKHGVKNGMEISASDLKKYKQISADGKVRGRALEWVMNRPRSIREFRDYMFRKKADKQLSEKLLQEFLSKKYIDESKFVAWFTDLSLRKNKSNRAITSELIKKGIEKSQINEMLNDESDESMRLDSVIAKKAKLSRYKNDPAKLARYLTSQGYNWDLVKSKIKDLETVDQD